MHKFNFRIQLLMRCIYMIKHHDHDKIGTCSVGPTRPGPILNVTNSSLDYSKPVGYKIIKVIWFKYLESQLQFKPHLSWLCAKFNWQIAQIYDVIIYFQFCILFLILRDLISWCYYTFKVWKTMLYFIIIICTISWRFTFCINNLFWSVGFSARAWKQARSLA